MRLSDETLGRFPEQVSRPSYDRRQPVGIVHFGLGAFHRAHQAWYTDACLDAGESGWMIAGISMRSASVADQLNPQDGLYTLTERSGAGSATRIIGSVREVLVASPDRAKIVERIASADCHLVSFTITEKGYCRAPDGSLDLALARNGFYPLLSDALARRREAGLPGLTLLSCDNLSANGKQLGKLMREWLEIEAADLAPWYAGNCTTPDSMVDRIVPASTDADIAELESRIGQRDEGAVFTEPFSQWVIEDDFAGPRPRWEKHGAQIVEDVAPYETAKLRMLNGAHSLLAYAGLDAGYTFVHEAISDPRLRALAKNLMQDEAAPTIDAGAGQDLESYADALIARFENPALNHRLIQIAMDGSQKIRQRWLDTLAIQTQRGRSCQAIMTGLAHWLRHVRGDLRPVDDPLASEMEDTWRQAGTEGMVRAMFGADGLIKSDWKPEEAQVSVLESLVRGKA